MFGREWNELAMILFLCLGRNTESNWGDTVKFTRELGSLDSVWGFGAIACGEKILVCSSLQAIEW